MTDEHTLSNVRGGAAVGAVYGGLLGALIGWIIASIPDPMPVIGPMVGQGVIATTLVALLAGVGLGALLGALFGAFSTPHIAPPNETQVPSPHALEEVAPTDMEVEPFTLDSGSTPPFGVLPPRQVGMADELDGVNQLDIISNVEPPALVQEEVVETVAFAQEDVTPDIAALHGAPPQPREEPDFTAREPEAEADSVEPVVRRPARRIVREQKKDL